MVRKFNPTSENPARAVQVWEILVGKAMNRQSVTYEILSELMYGKKAPGVLNSVLGHVAYYCEDNGLPPLTVLVVGESSGIPGEGFRVIDADKRDEYREQVFGCNWYDIYPPSEAELADAYKNHHQTGVATA